VVLYPSTKKNTYPQSERDSTPQVDSQSQAREKKNTATKKKKNKQVKKKERKKKHEEKHRKRNEENTHPHKISSTKTNDMDAISIHFAQTHSTIHYLSKHLSVGSKRSTSEFQLDFPVWRYETDDERGFS
jgi:hypothetical protein